MEQKCRVWSKSKQTFKCRAGCRDSCLLVLCVNPSTCQWRTYSVVHFSFVRLVGRQMLLAVTQNSHKMFVMFQSTAIRMQEFERKEDVYIFILTPVFFKTRVFPQKRKGCTQVKFVHLYTRHSAHWQASGFMKMRPSWHPLAWDRISIDNVSYNLSLSPLLAWHFFLALSESNFQWSHGLLTILGDSGSMQTSLHESKVSCRNSLPRSNPLLFRYLHFTSTGRSIGPFSTVSEQHICSAMAVGA